MKKLSLYYILFLSLYSCTLPQVNHQIWSLKQFRDAKITVFDINNDKTPDLIVSGYQKGGSIDQKKVLFIESDLKNIDTDTGKWEGRGYEFYLDKEYKLWVRVNGKAERVKGNVFKSNVNALINDQGELEILFNDKKETIKKNKWSITGLSIWIDKNSHLWIQEGDNKIIARLGKWKRKLNVVVNPLGEWIKGTGYKRGGKTDLNHIPIGDCIAAIDGKTKKILWSFQAVDEIENYPSISDGKVFIGGKDRSFYALDLYTGKQVWKYMSESPIETTSAVIKNTVFFGNKTGLFHALNTENGRLRWSFRANGAIDSSPAVYENKVFFGSWDKNLYALDIKNGKVKWRVSLPSYIGKSSPIVYDNKVIVGSWDKNLYAFNADTGKNEWVFKTNDWIDKASPSAGGGLVYIGNKSGLLHAINVESGIMKWQFNTGDAITSAPVITKNRVYLTSRDGYLYALSPKDGHLVWESRTRFRIFGSPAVADDTIYYSSLAGFLNATIDTGMGKPYWPMFGGDPTHKHNMNSALSFSKKILPAKTSFDTFLEDNGIKQKD